jgi:DNA integrity scanning protein DisA with diadenylate cyclase activity
MTLEEEALLELLAEALLNVSTGSLIVVTDGDEEPRTIDDGFAFLIPPWGEA